MTFGVVVHACINEFMQLKLSVRKQSIPLSTETQCLLRWRKKILCL